MTTESPKKSLKSAGCHCPTPAYRRPQKFAALRGEHGRLYNLWTRQVPNAAPGVREASRNFSDSAFFRIDVPSMPCRARAPRQESRRLTDAVMQLMLSTVNIATDVVPLCLQEIAKQVSVRDAQGNITHVVTPCRISRKMKELCNLGLIAMSNAVVDRIDRINLTQYVRVTPLFWRLAGASEDALLRQKLARRKKDFPHFSDHASNSAVEHMRYEYVASLRERVILSRIDRHQPAFLARLLRASASQADRVDALYRAVMARMYDLKFFASRQRIIPAADRLIARVMARLPHTIPIPLSD
ncbi:plasmid replication initiator RepA [Erwinia tasmaniensis]|uniref:Replication protein n=1 Tax=Erwinia tasmaniensis (strain DSM 17950 / CFBP 7177 / CIP 109463 / NCPPB 4357 / Et1/99) TaxID=465817 RepID=B2VB38_ERWT9|nr:plasmid replication initiator RepA [Erwinia tasmaniensis]CAO94974.1 Replication protein [Erwinia tasmaniensis Et1/99]